MADFPGTVGDDTLSGGAEADTISDGGGGSDTLNGNDGDDVITTSGGNDTVSGGAGIDRLVINAAAFAGNTLSHATTGAGSFSSPTAGSAINWVGIENITYTGGNGFNDITLGTGNHVVTLGNAADVLRLAEGTITADGRSSADRIDFGNASAGVTFNFATGVISGASLNGTAINFEDVFASNFNDIIIGNSTTTLMAGMAGNDVLDTGSRSGAILLNGGAGDDIFVVRDGATVTLATTGPNASGIDTVETDIGNFTLPAGNENLEYFGSAAFTGTGNSSANVIVGGGMNDLLSGLEGNDNLGGEAGDDVLTGGDGDDRLIGGTGADAMSGGAGNDILVVDNAADVALGGSEVDTVQIAATGLTYTIHDSVENVSNISGGAATVTLNALANSYGGAAGIDRVVAGDGDDIVYGRGGDDNVQGGNGNDRIFGDDGADTMTGGAGNDVMYGGIGGDRLSGNDGNDVMWGGDGSDVLNGSAGVDTYYGGTGFDFFQFGGLYIDGNTAPGTGNTLATADRIMDYSAAQSDRFDLQQIDADTTLAGDQGFTYLGTGAFTGVAGQLRYQVMGSETIIMGDLNGDGASDFMIRVAGVHALAESSFFL